MTYLDDQNIQAALITDSLVTGLVKWAVASTEQRLLVLRQLEDYLRDIRENQEDFLTLMCEQLCRHMKVQLFEELRVQTESLRVRLSSLTNKQFTIGLGDLMYVIYSEKAMRLKTELSNWQGFRVVYKTTGKIALT